MVSFRATDEELELINKLAAQVREKHPQWNKSDVLRELVGLTNSGIITREMRASLHPSKDKPTNDQGGVETTERHSRQTNNDDLPPGLTAQKPISYEDNDDLSPKRTPPTLETEHDPGKATMKSPKQSTLPIEDFAVSSPHKMRGNDTLSGKKRRAPVSPAVELDTADALALVRELDKKKRKK